MFVIVALRTDKDLEDTIESVFGPFETEAVALAFVDECCEPALPLRYVLEPLETPDYAKASTLMPPMEDIFGPPA